jgi:hypothetical protein
MRTHRVHGIALAAIAAGGLALSRSSGSGAIGTSSRVPGGSSVTSHVHTARAEGDQRAIRAVPANQSANQRRSGNQISHVASSWRDVAQNIGFNDRGEVTTHPEGTASQGRLAAIGSSIVDSTAVSVQERQQETFVYLVGLQMQAEQQYLNAMFALGQLSAAIDAQQAAAARAAAASAAAAQAAAPPPASAGSGAGGPWAALRNCESGGNYSENTGNGYYGAYQFSLSTWQGLGYSGYPNQASPAEQDTAAAALQARSGWGQWPSCSRQLGL